MIQKDNLSSNVLAQGNWGHLDSMQWLMLLLRRIQLGIDSLILLYIVFRIISKKFYKYKTLKLFLLVVLSYLVGLAAVLFHSQSFVPQFKYYFSESDSLYPNFYDLMNEMKLTEKILCGGEAFINLFFYDLGYFFSILITYNVYCVINGSYRTKLNNLKSKLFVLLMFLIYLIPWIFLFMYNGQSFYSYSYGPTGFKWYEPERNVTLILYCGPQSKNNLSMGVIEIVNIYICPILMVLCHIIYIWRNRRRMNSLEAEEYLNTNQKFLIESGKIGIIVFLIQLLNLLKTGLSFIQKNNSGAFIIFLVILNFFFDLYPLVLAFFFHKYTKQAERVQRASTTMLQNE